jgi:type II secretory pathway pseudopilin PulG
MKKATQKGFSTLEIVIAFAVMTLSMTAIIMVAFGNQSTAIDTELAQRGLYMAQRHLEETAATLKTNFNALAAGSFAEENGADYDTDISITEISECVKRIESSSSWGWDARDINNSLSMVVTDPVASSMLGGDCATEETSDDWDNPGTLVSEAAGGAGATSIDEFRHYVYLTSNPGTANNKAELYIYEFDETNNSLTEVSSLDLGKDGNGANGVKFGLNDIDVIEDYAFVASASTTAQLQVIDISSSTNPILKWKVGLPGVSPTGSFPGGRRVYYYNDRLYVGINETNGPEFHIFDVQNVASQPPQHLGSLELTHNIHEIVVRDEYAYIASSDNNHELMAINISTPSSLVHPDSSKLGYDADGSNNGSALYVTNDRVYLGRVQNNPKKDEFLILSRATVLDNTVTTDGLLGSKDTGLSNNSYVTGIRVNGPLAFLSLNDSTVGLAIYNITDASNIFLPATCSELNTSENGSGIDNDANNTHMFMSHFSNDEIRIIYDQTNTCTP